MAKAEWHTRALAAIAMLVLVARCSSPPTHYYTVEGVPPSRPAARRPALHPPIEVGDVPVPAIMDRGSIVVSAGDDRVEVSDQDHWAAPVGALVRQALTADLTTRLPSGSVLPPGGIAPHSGVRVLSVHISRFIGDTDGNVVLTASWALLRGGSSQVLRTGQEAIHGRAESGQIAAIVPAMSAALGQFADQVAVQVER